MIYFKLLKSYKYFITFHQKSSILLMHFYTSIYLLLTDRTRFLKTCIGLAYDTEKGSIASCAF